MVPELGHFALIIALILAVIQGVVPLVGTHKNSPLLMGYGRSLATGQFVFLFISIFCLGYAFVQDDFSVKYVANHSNTLLPIYYKISAIWGGHEGSLLLWALILGGWTWAVAAFSKSLPLDIVARVLAIMGLISVGFLLFILLTSNPFDRYLPNIPREGADLNPLLQDFGLIVHPPMLYMGYVGFSVAFAFAVAALLSGRLDAAWARWSRPWTTLAWAFLTVGIALGSWWAYYELGWGGWWFWDPVENASFMPWLVGTALMHSLAVTEKRGAFKSWTVLLAIIAFSLCLLGTFLVRSGVLTSVHAFASDPARGMFILGLLGITLVSSLGLYAWRVPEVKSKTQHELLSRESFLLVNNILLVAAWVAVMLGTLYPLVIDFIGGTKLSIGPPYFNAVFVPMMSVLAVVLAFGVVGRWKKTELSYLKQQLWKVAVVSVVVALAVPFMVGDHFSIGAFIAALLGAWVTGVTVKDIWQKSADKKGRLHGIQKLRRAYWGMVMGHIGFAFVIVGAAMVTIYAEERDVRMSAGVSVNMGSYYYHFEQVKSVRGPNYDSEKAVVRVTKDGKTVTTLYPEKRVYFAQRNPMTEAAIDAGFFRDLYVALGEPLGGGAWAVRLQYKPFVRWIWLGSLIMSIGGIVALSDKRYRMKLRSQSKQESQASASTGTGAVSSGTGVS